MNIFEVLTKLNINYEVISHEAVYTVEQAKKIKHQLSGIGCKNLFIKDKNKNYYLLILEENKKADFKTIEKAISTKGLTFASTEELKNILNLEPGSVTPLSIINDKDNKVLLIFDKDLKNNRILCHPNVNTKTLSLEFKDLERLIDYTKHKYIFL